MLTREETIKAAECCYIIDECKACPLNKLVECGEELGNSVLHYLKEKEPAPEATGTSSTKENTLQIDDSTKNDICQVLASATSNILGLYQAMELNEKKAFDLGEAYKDICCASAWMSSVRKGGEKND